MHCVNACVCVHVCVYDSTLTVCLLMLVFVFEISLIRVHQALRDTGIASTHPNIWAIVHDEVDICTAESDSRQIVSALMEVLVFDIVKIWLCQHTL